MWKPVAQSCVHEYAGDVDKHVPIRGALLSTNTMCAFQPSSRPWYQAAIAARRTVWTEMYKDINNGHPMITLTTPVYANTTLYGMVNGVIAPSSAELLGVVATDVYLDELSHILQHVSHTTFDADGISAALVNSTGHLLAISDPDYPLSSLTELLTSIQPEPSETHVEILPVAARAFAQTCSSFPSGICADGTQRFFNDLWIDMINVTYTIRGGGGTLDWHLLLAVTEARGVEFQAPCTGQSIALIVSSSVVAVLAALVPSFWYRFKTIGRRFVKVNESENNIVRRVGAVSITAMVFLTFTLVLGIFLIWSTAINKRIEHIVDILSVTTGKRVQDTLTDHLLQPVAANHFMAILLDVGEIPLIAPSTLPDLPYAGMDKYQVLDSFWYIMITVFPSLTEIYVGGSDGQFAGGLHSHTLNLVSHTNASTGCVERHTFGDQNVLFPMHNTSGFYDQRCPFDPRTRPWYLHAIPSTTTWTSPYIFSNDGLPGITAVFEVNNTHHSRAPNLAVFGVDYGLADIGNFLSHIKLKRTGPQDHIIFVISRNGMLVATSSGQAIDSLPASCTAQQSSLNSTSVAMIREVHEELQLFFGQRYYETMTSWHGTVGVTSRTLSVSLSTYHAAEGSLDWLVIVGVPNHKYFADIEIAENLSFLIGFGVTALVLFFIRVLVSQSHDSPPKGEEDVELQRGALHDRLVLDKRLVALRPLLHESLCRHFKSSCIPRAMAQEYAQDYILHSQQGRDIPLLLELEAERYEQPLKVYLTHTHWAVEMVVYAALFMHLGLALLEAPLHRDKTGPEARDWLLPTLPRLVAVEAALLVIHITDLCLFAYVRRLRSETRNLLIFRSLLLFVFFIDWTMRASTSYYSGCHRVPSDPLYNAPNCAVVLMPLSVLIRPLLLVARNLRLRLAIRDFGLTLLYAKDVMALFACFLCVAIMCGITLLRTIVPGHATWRGFSNVFASFSTMFVFMTTADNYASITSQAHHANVSFQLFFVVFSAIASILIASLLIAVFEGKYTAAHEVTARRVEATKQDGALVAYLLLTEGEGVDGGEENPDAREHEGLKNQLMVTASDRVKTIAALPGYPLCPRAPGVCLGEFKAFFELWETGLAFRCPSHYTLRLTTSQFVGIVNRLLPLYGDRPPVAAWQLRVSPPSAWMKWRLLWQRVTQRAVYGHVVFLLVLTTIWFLSLYGTVSDDFVDVLCFAMLVVWTLEVLLRALAFGYRYWWNPHDLYTQLTNRFDALIMLTAVVIFIISRATLPGVIFDAGNPMRLALALPSLRVFNTVRSARTLLFGILLVMPHFKYIIYLLGLVFYLYAVLGSMIFSGGLRVLTLTQYSTPWVNFDSVIQSLLTLWEAAMGEWSMVLHATFDALQLGVTSSVFFISFVTIITLLFMNLLAGLVIDSYRAICALDMENVILSAPQLLSFIATKHTTNMDVDRVMSIALKQNSVTFGRDEAANEGTGSEFILESDNTLSDSTWHN